MAILELLRALALDQQRDGEVDRIADHWAHFDIHVPRCEKREVERAFAFACESRAMAAGVTDELDQARLGFGIADAVAALGPFDLSMPRRAAIAGRSSDR